MFLGPRRHGGQRPCPFWPLGNPQCLAGASLPAHPRERQTLHLPFALGSGESCHRGLTGLLHEPAVASMAGEQTSRTTRVTRRVGCDQTAALGYLVPTPLSEVPCPVGAAATQRHRPHTSREAGLGFLCLRLPSLMSGVFFYDRAKESSLLFPPNLPSNTFTRESSGLKICGIQKKRLRWTYLQGRNRDTDVENRRADAGRRQRGQDALGGETPTHTLPCVNRSLVGAAAPHRGAQLCLWGDPESRRGVQRAGGTCMHATHNVMYIHTTYVYTHSHCALQQKPTQR